MARITHPAQLHLRFGDVACEVLYFAAGARSGNFGRKDFNFFGQHRIGMDGQA